MPSRIVRPLPVPPQPPVFVLRGCPACHGDLALRSELGMEFLSCIMCGREIYKQEWRAMVAERRGKGA